MTAPEPSNEWLAEKFTACQTQDGNARKAAWEELAEVLFPLLLKIANQQVFRLYRRPNGDLAHDLAMEVFLKLYGKGHAPRHTQNIEGWLRVTVHNKLLDMRKHFNALREVALDLTTEFEPAEELEFDPDKDAREARDTALRAAIRTLDADRRLLLHLSYWEEKTNTEIGEWLGADRKVIKDRIARARGRLRQILTDNGIAP